MALKVNSDIALTGSLTVSGSYGLAAADIPSLAADKITSGTFAAARIPSLAASKITSGTFADARIASAANWNTAYGWGNHAAAGYSTFDGAYDSLTGRPTIPTNNNQLTNGAGYVTSSGNTVIGTDSDINTSGATIIDNIYVTDGVITSMGTRTLTPGDIGAAYYDHFRSLGTTAFTAGGGSNDTITTAQLISEMEGDGAFDSYTSAFKTSWSYAGNDNLTDAGDFTETAGTAWLTWTDNSSDSTRGNITALAIAPNTGGSAGRVFIYNDQGSSYSPGWREVWTNSSLNPFISASVSNDTITFTKADGTTSSVTTSDANTNYYLNGITKSGNTLTFSVNGTTNQTYTFGSLAFSSATYDNYGSWNLKTGGTQRTTVGSGGDLDIVGGTNVSVAYSAGGVVTISSTDTNTTYSVGDGGLTQKNFTTTLKNKLDGIATSADAYGGWNISDGTNSEKIQANNTLTVQGGGAASVSYDSGNNTLTVNATDTNTTYSVGDGGLTQKNFTTTLKNKLDGIASGAEVNVQSDWNATSGDALILNKPTIPTNNNQLTNGAGYITSYTETDTLDRVADRGATTNQAITTGGITATYGNFGSTASNPQVRIFTENATASIADTFTDTTTDKSYIYFNAGTGSSDPGFIMHETSEDTSPDERNEGVLHLVPSDDNVYGDYVSIHGTNDADVLKLHTSGVIETATGYQLVLTSGNAATKVDDTLHVTGRLYVDTIDTNTTSTSALVEGSSGEIEKRTLGSNAFNSTAYSTASGVEDNADVTDTANVVAALTAGTNITIAADGTISSTDTNTTYSTATSSTLGLVKIGYTENGKNYPVELSSGKMFVNVPWTDTNTDTDTITRVGVSGSEASGVITLAASGAASISQSGSTVTISSTDTNTQLSDTQVRSKISGTGLISYNSSTGVISTTANNYSLPAGSSTVRGGFKIGYTENGKNYPVEVSSEQMYVNVPWTDTNTTYSNATTSTAGLMSTTDKSKLDGIAASANNYSLPAGSSTVRGGFKIGYAENGKNYPVEVSSEKMYVNVPWTDTNTTYSNATTSTAGLMSSTDKSKLNGIASGATVYSGWNLTDGAGTSSRIDSLEYVKFSGADITGSGSSSDPFVVVTPDNNTTYTADGNYGMTLSGTAFRLEDDRRRNSTSTDIYTGNTHDYTFYDASVGIRWYTAGAEEMRLEDDGDLHVDGDVVAFSATVSDARLKDDVETIENATEKVKRLRGVEYTWNKGGREGQREIGVIAQEVEKVVPEIVHEKKLPFIGDETYKTVDYEKLVALLIESNKELAARVETLEAKLDGITK